ncbi:peptidase [Luteimonas terricola]|uniref:peptidase n=1 Tax=Luteimonas terricola TaxID=645597 RepID=UPI001042A65D|nr:peptidase [Luteimonas terricola]
MNKPSPKPLVIFKAGTHVDNDGREHTFSEADIAEIAASYEPDLAEAPLVVGHPELNAPAYGWARSLSVKDGVLFAEPHQVEPQFAGLVNAGRMKKISAAIYLPTTPGNPKPGKHYLKHIGFLGAAAPAVKGLRSAAFSADDGALEFSMPLRSLGHSLANLFQRLRDHLVEREGAEAADRIIPQWQIRDFDQLLTDSPAETDVAAIPTYAEAPAGAATLETDMSESNTAAQFAERETALTGREAGLAEREQRLADRETQARRDDAAEFAEGLVQAGQLLPRQKAPVVELLLALPADTALTFAEGDGQVKKPATEVLRTFLGDLPKQVDFREKGAAAVAADVGVANFAAPTGVSVDAGRAELYGKAKAYMREHPNTAFHDAVAAVGG